MWDALRAVGDALSGLTLEVDYERPVVRSRSASESSNASQNSQNITNVADNGRQPRRARSESISSDKSDSGSTSSSRRPRRRLSFGSSIHIRRKRNSLPQMLPETGFVSAFFPRDGTVLSVERELSGLLGGEDVHRSLVPIVLLDEEDLGLTFDLREFVAQLAAHRDTWTDFPVERLLPQQHQQQSPPKPSLSEGEMHQIGRRDVLSVWRLRQFHSLHDRGDGLLGKDVPGQATAAMKEPTSKITRSRSSSVSSVGTSASATLESVLPPLRLTRVQELHAREILRLVPELAQLRFELCPETLSEDDFWRIYFALVAAKVGDCVGPILPTQNPTLEDDPTVCRMCFAVGGDPLFVYKAQQIVAHRQEAQFKLSKQSVLDQLLKNRDKSHRYWETSAPQIDAKQTDSGSTAADACERIRKGLASGDRDCAWLLLLSVYRESHNRRIGCDAVPQLQEFLDDASPSYDRALRITSFRTPPNNRREDSLESDHADGEIRHRRAHMLERMPALLNSGFSDFPHCLSARYGWPAQHRILFALCSTIVAAHHFPHKNDTFYDHDEQLAIMNDVVNATIVHPALIMAPDVAAMLLLFLEEDLAFAVLHTVFRDVSSLECSSGVSRSLNFFDRFSLDCFPVALWLLLKAHVPQLYIHVSENLFLTPDHPDVVQSLASWFARIFVGVLPLQSSLRILDCLLCPCICAKSEEVCKCNSGEVILFEAALALLARSQDILLLSTSRQQFWDSLNEIAASWNDPEGLVRFRLRERLAYESGASVELTFTSLVRTQIEEALVDARALLLPPMVNVSTLVDKAFIEHGGTAEEGAKALNALWSRMPPRLQLKSPALLFRASIDGFNAGSLMRACTMRSPTLVLIKVKNSPVIAGALLTTQWLAPQETAKSSSSTRHTSTVSAESMVFQLSPKHRRRFCRWSPGRATHFLHQTPGQGFRIGATALSLDHDLLHGSSGPSDTFGNDASLVSPDSNAGGATLTFECADVEVFQV